MLDCVLRFGPNRSSEVNMRNGYDSSDSRRAAHAPQLKKQITIRLDEDVVAYFKSASEESGIPYQSLINLYLRDCAASQRKLSMSWKKSAASQATARKNAPAVEQASKSGHGPASPLKSIIVDAISSKRTLSFKYHGTPRLVEPQSYGVGAKGTELLRGHQIKGGSQKEPLFDVSKIEDLVSLDRRFSKPGPHYKRNDSAMKTMIAQL
jgi:uncharacterized protein (DUF4415 family)